MLRPELQRKLDKRLSNLLQRIEAGSDFKKIQIEARKILDDHTKSDSRRRIDQWLLYPNWDYYPKSAQSGRRQKRKPFVASARFYEDGEDQNQELADTNESLFTAFTSLIALVCDSSTRTREEEHLANARSSLRDYLDLKGHELPKRASQHDSRKIESIAKEVNSIKRQVRKPKSHTEKIREQRNNFSRQRRKRGHTWMQIYMDYHKKYPLDEKASDATLRLTFNRHERGD